MRGHHLHPRATADHLVAVVRDMCGVQAQVMAAARLSLRARVDGLLHADMDRALWEERTLAKTWAMRGTVHILPTEDLPVFISALEESAIRILQSWERSLGIRPEEAESKADALVEALAGDALTRDELSEIATGGSGLKGRQWVEQGWADALRRACIRGRVCYGPDRGQKVTFIRRDAWLGEWQEVSPEDARKALLRRYLHCYGPATVQDFAYWSGMTVGDARATWGAIEDETVQVSVGGTPASMLHDDLDALEEVESEGLPLRLLPLFDVYLLGHKDKSHLVDAGHYKKVYRKAGWISAVVLSEGRCAGTWSLDRSRKEAVLKVEPFGEPARDISDAIGREAEALADFYGSESISTVLEH